MSAQDAMEDARWRKDQERLIRAEVTQSILDDVAYHVGNLVGEWAYSGARAIDPGDFHGFMRALRDELVESISGNKGRGCTYDGMDVHKRMRGEYP